MNTDTHGTSVCDAIPSAHDVRDGLGLHETYTWHLPCGTVHWGDALTRLVSLATGSVDAVLTDPPYSSLDRWRAVGTTTRLGGGLKAENRDETKFFPTISNEDLWEVLCELSRVLKSNAHAWMMCDGQTLGVLLGYACEGYNPDPRNPDPRLGGGHKFKYFKPYPVLKRAAGGGYRCGPCLSPRSPPCKYLPPRHETPDSTRGHRGPHLSLRGRVHRRPPARPARRCSAAVQRSVFAPRAAHAALVHDARSGRAPGAHHG